jgi:L-rhamnono-1,4-lactonase
MEQPPTASETKSVNFTRWKAAISRMAKEERVYMKLSGAFSEIVDQDPSSPMPVEDVIERMQPWLDHIFTEFGPWRIMFGSDWPVCNVRGPGDTKSWSCWVDVVGQILQSRGLSEIEMNRVWYGTAIEAYRLDPIR